MVAAQTLIAIVGGSGRWISKWQVRLAKVNRVNFRITRSTQRNPLSDDDNNGGDDNGGGGDDDGDDDDDDDDDGGDEDNDEDEEKEEKKKEKRREEEEDFNDIVMILCSVRYNYTCVFNPCTAGGRRTAGRCWPPA